MKRTAITHTRIATLALLGAAALLLAGPLDPPAGPVSPTYKTLAEIEPRTAINATNTPGDADSLYSITQPGSYYLTGNVTGVSGRNGIKIASSGVTIDLNGFELIGVAGALNGIYLSQADTRNTAVMNGAVSSWPGTGIYLSTINYGGRLENLRAESNGGDGIVGGNAYTISGCSAVQNGGTGISAFIAASVTNCASRNNGGSGFNFTTSPTISNCTAYSNSSNGFNVGESASISRCTAVLNGTNGFVLSSGEISHCTAGNNALDGIRVSSDCLVIDNSCRLNGTADGAGIHATSDDNRIESNNCIGADRGIDVDAAGNYIIANSCSGNAVNWDVAAGNACVVYSAQTSGAIVGDSGGGSPVLKDPQANITY